MSIARDYSAFLYESKNEDREPLHVHQLIVIESRFAPRAELNDEQKIAELAHNIRVVRAACRFAYLKGYNPFASHLFYTQFMDERSAKERSDGILMGLRWAQYAKEAWFIIEPELGMSSGMEQAYDRHTAEARPIKEYHYNATTGIFTLHATA